MNVAVFVFASNNITNIWAGYGARRWAVSGEGEMISAKKTKASKVTAGSFGLLYCTPWKSFTVPFVISTPPEIESVEGEIWEGEWIIPFTIIPLGSPRKRMHNDRIRDLPGFRDRGLTNVSHYLSVQGNFAFQPSTVSSDDWAAILKELGDEP
ncbi:hypothetical protein HKCCE3408_04695 [Rhodobacterales bacterium HKCCE3408]|nr:hypothetical protein [Rhodobacterales bacterium HKCCE3408]